MSIEYWHGMPLEIGDDWKKQRYIANPCPVCGKQMAETMTAGDFRIFECTAPGCTGREVHGARRNS